MSSSSPITNTLAVPLVSQLNDPPSDGLPDNNADDNCLFASSASALMGYHPGTRYDADEIKDAVMGAGYTGFGYFSAKLTAYLARNGVAITVESGAALPGIAHSFIDRGVPLLAVIPSLWGVQQGAVTPNFSTHVVLLCGDGASWLRAMNPWGGFWQDQPDAWWASRFCYGALWALLPNGGSGIGMADNVPTGWHDNATTGVLTAPNGVATEGYIRAHILNDTGGWPANLWPVAPLYGIAGGWQQDFVAATRSIVATLGGAVSEKAGPVYVPDAQLAAAEAQVKQATAQVATLQQQLDAANAEIAALKANPPAPPTPTPAPTPPVSGLSAEEIAAATVAALAAKLSAGA